MKLACPKCKGEEFDLLITATDINISDDGTLKFKCLNEYVNHEAGFVCTECQSSGRDFDGQWELKATPTKAYLEALKRSAA